MATSEFNNPVAPTRHSNIDSQKNRDIAAKLEMQGQMQKKEISRERTGDSESKKIAKALRKQAKIEAPKAVVAPEVGAQRKHKKRKHSRGEEAHEDRDEESKNQKKAKKGGVTETVHLEERAKAMTSGNCGEDNAQNSQVIKDAARKERKRLKKIRKEQEVSENAMLDVVQESPDRLTDLMKSKKKKRKSEERSHKSKKKAAVLSDSSQSNVLGSAGNEGKQATMSADQWNPDALSGDAARKSKFLRLLGAGKNTGLDANMKPERSSGNVHRNVQRIESELERQFDAGIRMKHDGQSKRRGLGA